MTGRERLSLLLNQLKKDNPSPQECGNNPRFDIMDWRRASPRHSCGTAFCAGGIACMMPELQEEGLFLLNNIPQFKYKESYFALAGFFELSFPKTQYIFSPSQYDGPRPNITVQMVIDRLEEVLAKEVLAKEVLAMLLRIAPIKSGEKHIYDLGIILSAYALGVCVEVTHRFSAANIGFIKGIYFEGGKGMHIIKLQLEPSGAIRELCVQTAVV